MPNENNADDADADDADDDDDDEGSSPIQMQKQLDERKRKIVTI